MLKQFSMPLLLSTALVMAACGGSGGVSTASNPQQPTDNSQSTAGNGNIDTGSSTGSSNLFPITQGPTDASNAGQNGVSSVTSPLRPLPNGLDIAASDTQSVLTGRINVLNDEIPVGNVNVRIRGTDITGTRDADGNFSLLMPVNSSESTVILEISGEGVIDKSIEVQVPANAEQVAIDTNVGAHNPPMTINLEEEREYFYDDNTMGASVTIPANALQYPDGTIATGSAQLSITEIDISDLDGESAWAPPLVGLVNGTTETGMLQSFGMADYTFSQNGQELDLRPGVQATIKMHLQSPFRVSMENPGELIAVNAGDVIPLWYYDDEQLAWIEEGTATVFEDPESPTGLSFSGQVTHFTPWNGDVFTTSVNINVNVIVVDHNGATIPGLTATSWNAGGRSMTPSNNSFSVAYTARQQPCEECDVERWVVNSGVTVSVNNVSITGLTGTYSAPPSQSVTFGSGSSYNLTFRVVIDMRPVLTPVAVNVRLVDEAGGPVDIDVTSYRAVAETVGGSYVDQRILTPTTNTVSVEGNTPQMLAATNRALTTRITVDDVVVGEPVNANINVDPMVVTGVYTAGGSHSETVTVIVDIEGRSDR